MAATLGKNRCVTCGKDKATMRCGGCLQEYCYNHLADHRQELHKQLDEVEVSRDLFRQTLSEQTADSQKYLLIQRINEWECDSIKKIQQTAEEARESLLRQKSGYIRQIEVDLNRLTEQLRQSRVENDFHETDLRHWNDELKRLAKELDKPSKINLRYTTTSLINKISIEVASMTLCTPNITSNAKWVQNGITVAGGNGAGDGYNQFQNPFGVYVDDNQIVYVVDRSNHRIVKWKGEARNGEVIAGGNGQGHKNNQLNKPSDMIVAKEDDSIIICDRGNRRIVKWSRQNSTSGETIISDIDCWGLAMDYNGYLYVCEHNQAVVKRWKIGDAVGTVVAGGHGQGKRLDQLYGPTNIFVDKDYSVYVSEDGNNRVTKWLKGAKEGIIVAGGQGSGDNLAQLSSPRGVLVDQSGTVYVVEFGNERIMRWLKGATQGSVVVGGNGSGSRSNQLDHPLGLSFDQEGNLYVADNVNHRIQKFNIDPTSNT